jgi:hypothetical protein
MLIGATSLETPSTIVFPQPWTNQAITNQKRVATGFTLATYEMTRAEM